MSGSSYYSQTFDSVRHACPGTRIGDDRSCLDRVYPVSHYLGGPQTEHHWRPATVLSEERRTTSRSCASTCQGKCTRVFNFLT